MSAEWISRLSAVSPSMGLMLETTNSSLLAPGAAHDNAPDKLPAKRLRTIEEAGKQGVAFTTGILVGIGESLQDRVDALLAIRDLHRRYGHIQEIIIQNFRAKPEIPMHEWPEPSRGEMLRTIAVARLLMPNANIQAPPNLSDPDYEELLDAGINDWGGISPLTPDFINPERPWPHLEQLEKRTLAPGVELVVGPGGNSVLVETGEGLALIDGGLEADSRELMKIAQALALTEPAASMRYLRAVRRLKELMVNAAAHRDE